MDTSKLRKEVKQGLTPTSYKNGISNFSRVKSPEKRLKKKKITGSSAKLILSQTSIKLFEFRQQIKHSKKLKINKLNQPQKIFIFRRTSDQFFIIKTTAQNPFSKVFFGPDLPAHSSLQVFLHDLYRVYSWK